MRITEYRRILKDKYSIWEKNYNKYQKHLLEPSNEFLKKKSDLLGIDLEILTNNALPIRANNRGKPLIIRNDASSRLSMSMHVFDSIKNHTIKVRPRSLTQLKHLVGIPNEIHENSMKTKGVEKINIPYPDVTTYSPIEKGFKFGRLCYRDRKAVRRMARNLIHGHIDDSIFEINQNYNSVLEWLLTIDWSMFFAPDLIIPSGQKVCFENYSTLYFNNIILEGNGQINLGNNAKLHVWQIKHI